MIRSSKNKKVDSPKDKSPVHVNRRPPDDWDRMTEEQKLEWAEKFYDEIVEVNTK